MLAATLLGGGPLLASQAAASAVLVATLQPPSGGSTSAAHSTPSSAAAARLAVSSLLLPVNPLRLAARERGPGARPAGGGAGALDRGAHHAPPAQPTPRCSRSRAPKGSTTVWWTRSRPPATLPASPQPRGALSGFDRYVVAVGRARARDRGRSSARARRDAGDRARRLGPAGGGPAAIDELATGGARADARCSRTTTPGRPARRPLRAAALANAVLANRPRTSRPSTSSARSGCRPPTCCAPPASRARRPSTPCARLSSARAAPRRAREPRASGPARRPA